MSVVRVPVKADNASLVDRACGPWFLRPTGSLPRKTRSAKARRAAIAPAPVRRHGIAGCAAGECRAGRPVLTLQRERKVRLFPTVNAVERDSDADRWERIGDQ